MVKICESIIAKHKIGIDSRRYKTEPTLFAIGSGKATGSAEIDNLPHRKCVLLGSCHGYTPSSGAVVCTGITSHAEGDDVVFGHKGHI